MRLQNKIAIITGAASGIGAEIARRFVQEGAKVVIADLNIEGATQLAGELGEGCMARKHDVSDEASWKALITETLAAHSRLDVLVNCAGIMIPGDIETTSFELFNSIMSVNLGGVFLGCQNAVEAMKTNEEGGAIVNISSTSALRCPTWVTAYGTSKAAVLTLTRAVAVHCATNEYKIRCNAVAPGAALTPMVQNLLDHDPDPETALAAIVSQHPLGRLATPADVANAALYLASDESSYVTGTVIPVDGGAAAA
ncbi:MAG: glucose 1-dehydrogenase [Halieaceae bacterium]|jgi:3(or 17)beta-hydroxysteroid dehydrogenase|nr:glucose 1-dehydrogenase [Halieaceae bacterium]